MSVGVRTFEVLREEIRHAADEFEDEYADLWDKPDCPYCGCETEVGAVGGGEVKFGCYRDDNCSECQAEIPEVFEGAMTPSEMEDKDGQ